MSLFVPKSLDLPPRRGEGIIFSLPVQFPRIREEIAILWIWGGRGEAVVEREHLGATWRRRIPGFGSFFGDFPSFFRDQRQVGHCCRFRHGAAPLFLGCFLVIFCKQLPKAAGMRERRGQKSAESRAAKSSFRGECLYSKVFPREMRARNSRGWKSSWVWGKTFRFLWGFHFFVNYYSGTGSGFN